MINKILDKSESWEDFYNLLRNTESSGVIFEEFARLYFEFEPVVKDDYNNVWLHSEIPLEIRTKLNLVSIDHGIDLLLETISNEYVAVQCKFRTDIDSNLSWSKDKIANLFAYGDRCSKFIVFSNTSRLDVVSTNRKENFEFINLDNLLQIKPQTFTVIKEYLNTGMILETPKYEPLNHQIEAVTKVLNHFENYDRAQLILPCGAGKTLTSLWIKEDIKAQNTLVLVPSLALLKQIKNSWSEQKNQMYKYLCVCSEKDIDEDKYDSPITQTYEIGGNVTTDKNKIKDFLINDGDAKVIFSTYQSLIKIKDAMESCNFIFDLVICDEAHKTAGAKGSGSFGLIHSDENVLARKRLYMTATPRVLSENIKTRLGSKADELLYDMSDEKVFGKEVYRMSFYDAINLGILVDYKILGIGVSDKDLAEYLKQRKFVGNKETIEDYANNYALELVMKKYNANHAISFHSRVRLAQMFSLRHKKLFDDIYCESVSGEQTTTHRNLVLNEFKNKPKGVVSNARCLTEGVDVPVIDLVYFADPKNSKIDIVQAAGRALRVNKHGKKDLGYVVVPIFHSKNKDLDKAIDKGVFKNLVNVIRSLCDQDERLQDEINKLAFQKGKRSILGERLEVVFEEAEQRVVSLVGFEEKLKNAIFDQVIEKASSNWGVKYENLKLWREVYPNEWPRQIPPKRRKTNNPAIIEENSLGVWLMGVRRLYRDLALNKYWVDKFNELDFEWDSSNARQKSSDKKFYEKLKKFTDTNNSLPNPKSSTSLAVGLRWRIEMYQKQKLGKVITSILDKYDFTKWIESAQEKKSWDDWLSEVVNYKNEFSKWPSSKINKNDPAYNIGAWLNLNKQKYRAGELQQDRAAKMKEAGIILEKIQDKIWDKHLEEIKRWFDEKGDWPKAQSQVGKCYEGKLGNWITSQKNWYWGNTANKSEYPDRRKKKLESIGINFVRTRQLSKSSWEIQFDHLEEYTKLNPNKWPKRDEQFPKGNNLGSWCNSQKQNYRKGKLQKFRQDMLESIGFDIVTSDENRIKGLQRWCERSWYATYNQIKFLSDSGIKITSTSTLHQKEYKWLIKQKLRHKSGELDQEKINFLKALSLL